MNEQLYGKILYHSKVGYLTILSDKHYIRRIAFGKQELPEEICIDNNHPIIMQAEQQLKEYLDGKREIVDLPYQIHGTAFQKSVWNALTEIPYGSTKTYGMIAKEIGSSKAARAVGRACHCNPIVIVIPCHRVIGTNGSLTGFAGGIPVKENLLQMEANQNHKSRN